MSFKPLTLAALAAMLAVPAFADGIKVMDPYARSSGASAKTGAAFMHIMNTGTEEDRLIAASSDAAKMVQLHTHKEDGDGVMKMIHVEEGFTLPAGEKLMLERGGNHVMLMGLTDSLEQGETISVTLTFEQAGDIIVEIPVDLERKPAHGGHGDHGTTKHNDS